MWFFSFLSGRFSRNERKGLKAKQKSPRPQTMAGNPRLLTRTPLRAGPNTDGHDN